MGADIDHYHPEVKSNLFDWGKWVIDSIGAAGFRFDAAKVRNFIDAQHLRKLIIPNVASILTMDS